MRINLNEDYLDHFQIKTKELKKFSKEIEDYKVRNISNFYSNSNTEILLIRCRYIKFQQNHLNIK